MMAPGYSTSLVLGRNPLLWRLTACVAVVASSVRSGVAQASTVLLLERPSLTRENNKGYAVIPRSTSGGSSSSSFLRGLQQTTTTESPSIAPVLPSFDGDVEAIYLLALDKAGVPYPTAAPVVGGGTAPSTPSRPLPSDYPSLVPVAWPTPSDATPSPFGGQGENGGAGGTGSDGPSLVPSDAPSRTPTLYPTAVFTAWGTGPPGGSDYPSLVPVEWPTTVPLLSDGPSLVPSQTPTGSPTLTPAPTLTAPLNPHSCTDGSVGESTNFTSAGGLVSYLTLTFTYTVETETSDATLIARAVGEGEEALQEMVAPQLLSCLNVDAAEGQIVALDSLPKDELNSDDTCDPVLDASNTCSVWTGYMRFFLSDAAAAPTATGLIVAQVESVLNSPAFVDRVGTGLLRAHFLQAQTDLQAAPVPPEGGSGSTGGDGSGSSPPANSSGDELAPDKNVTPAVLVAVGSAALVVIVGSVFYWRKSSSARNGGGGARGNPSSAATQMAGSSFNDTAADLSKGQGSPFSDMLPDSYRFNDNLSILSGNGGNGNGNGSGMSAILEDEEAHSQTSSAIFMSEAGYSEAAGETDTSLLSFDIPKSLYTRVPASPNLLGARKRNGLLGQGGPLPSGLLTDSGEDTSSVSDMEDDAGNGNTTGGLLDSPPVRKGAIPLSSLLDEYPVPGQASSGDLMSSSEDDSNSPSPPTSPNRSNNSNNNGSSQNNSNNNNTSTSLLPSADDSMQADDLLFFG